jgi:large subunit ribosomal protein L35
MHLDIPVVLDEERLGFDVRSFIQKWNLNGAKGGGAHMWRQVWDENVSLIYKDVLSQSPFFSAYSRQPF